MTSSDDSESRSILYDDLPTAFNNTEFESPLNANATMDCDFTDRERDLSRRIMALWGSVARDGVPGAAWLPFSDGAEATLPWTLRLEAPAPRVALAPKAVKGQSVRPLGPPRRVVTPGEA